MDEKPNRRPRRTLPRRAKSTLLAGGLVVLLTAGGGTAWALDRFVIPHVEVTDVAAYEAEHSDPSTSPATAETTAAEDSSVTITTVQTGTGSDTLTYHVADVVLGDATALRSAFANNQFGENVTELVSTIAEDNGALFAVNGDYYGFRDTGIVIRNGVVYRDSPAREGIVFYADGTAAIYDETETSAAELLADGAWNTLSFGPAIVEDGAVVAGIDDVEIDTNFGNHSIQGEQPRTAVGVIDDNHLVFVVVDGRSEGYSRGATLSELAEIMTSLGVQTAYNLDGGGSSEMWFDGDVVNRPSNGGERATSDILYIAG